MNTRNPGHPSIRNRQSDSQNLVAAEVTRLKRPRDQSLLTSAATDLDALPLYAFAFTRAELLVILAVLSLLALIVLPALAHDRARSSRIQCANNLRQIGAAMHTWGDGHGERPPYYVFPADGGTRNHPLAPNPWLHFSWVSNELASPRVLLCPSDTGSPAQDFSGNSNGGYLHPNFRNRATSYLLSHQGQFKFDPDKYMSGDRNVGGSSPGLSSLFGTCMRMQPNPANPLRWLNGLHSPAGNLLRNDGALEQLSDEGLSATYTQTSSSLFEFVVPR